MRDLDFLKKPCERYLQKHFEYGVVKVWFNKVQRQGSLCYSAAELFEQWFKTTKAKVKLPGHKSKLSY